MANIHQIKFGNFSIFGNYHDNKLSLDKDDSYSNSGLFNDKTKHSTTKNPDLQKQSTFEKYERERHEQEDTESDSDTDTGNQPNDTHFYSTIRTSKFDEIGVKKKDMSQLRNKTNLKRLKVPTSRTDELMRNTFKDTCITKLYEKSKITRILSKTFIKEIANFTTYPVRSYFDGEQSVLSQDLSNERIRFQTFHDYQGNGNPWFLSREGFYHVHAEGQYSTRCFRCNAAYSQWANNDDVSSVHRRLSPNCAFLNRDGSIASDLDIHGPGTNTTRRYSSTASGVSEAHRYINLASEKLRRESGAVRRNAEAALPPQQGFPTVDRFDNSNNVTQPYLEFNQRCISQESGDDGDIPFGSAIPAPFTQTSQNTTQMTTPLSSTRTGAELGMSHSDVPLQIPMYPEAARLQPGFPTVDRLDNKFNQRCISQESEDDVHIPFDSAIPAPFTQTSQNTEMQRRLSENMAGQREQHDERTDRINDSGVRAVVCGMQEMGYSANEAKRAAHEVLKQTGGNTVSLTQVLNWYLDHVDHEQSLMLHAEEETQRQTDATANSSSIPMAASRSSNYSSDARSIQEENRMLKEHVMCKICMDQSVHITFLPCGHLVCCANCAALFQQCPECKAQIYGCMTMRL